MAPLPPRQLALAAVAPLAARNPHGSTSAGRSASISRPLHDKDDRHAVDDALGEALADWPHERTAMNGFGFVQLVARLERPSLLHRLRADRARRGGPAAAAARRRGRRARRDRCSPRTRASQRCSNADGWRNSPAARGREVRGSADPALALDGGFAQASVPHEQHRRTCPICRKPRSDEFTPFCSSRCRDRDLANGSSDGYAVPGPPARRPRTLRRRGGLITPLPSAPGFAIGALPSARRSVQDRRRSDARVAQLVEHTTENRGVGGSIPPPGTIFFAARIAERRPGLVPEPPPAFTPCQTARIRSSSASTPASAKSSA